MAAIFALQTHIELLMSNKDHLHLVMLTFHCALYDVMTNKDLLETTKPIYHNRQQFNSYAGKRQWIWHVMTWKHYIDVIKWKHFPRYWPFVWRIHRPSVNSPHKDQWRGALMLSLICTWINGWVNNREAGDLRRHRAHSDVTVMMFAHYQTHYTDVITGTIASQITSLTIVYSIVHSGTDQRKHQSSASLAFVLGIHRWPVESPHKGPVTRKMFPFDDVIVFFFIWNLPASAGFPSQRTGRVTFWCSMYCQH